MAWTPEKHQYGWIHKDRPRTDGVNAGQASNSFNAPMYTGLTPSVGTAGTFTRTSAENYSSDGTQYTVTQKASGNACIPAFIYGIPTTYGGVQISGPRKNWFKDSADQTTANWTVYNALDSRTANAAQSPDGSTTATRLVATVDDRGVYQETTQACVSTKWVLSVWARCSSGSVNLYMSQQGGAGSDYSFVTRVINSTTWQRLEFYKAFSGIATGNARAYLTIGVGTVDLWGAQYEQIDEASTGSGIKYPSAYIPTTSAVVATAGDSLTYPSANISASLTKGHVTVWVAPFFDYLGMSTATAKYAFKSGNIAIWFGDQTISGSYGGQTLTAFTQVWNKNQFYRLTMSWDNTSSPASLRLLKNGVLIKGDDTLTCTTPSASTITMGASSTVTEYIDGIVAATAIQTNHILAATDLDEFQSTKLLYGYQPIDPSVLSYSGLTFIEAAGNAGAITQTQTITLQNDTFTKTSGTYTLNTHYSVSGVPSGLTVVLTAATATTLTMSFSGNAAAHDPANSTTMTLTMLSPAFTSTTTPASAAKTFSITFIGSTPAITYSATTFAEAAANDGSITATNTATLSNDTYVAGPFVLNTHYTRTGTATPAGLTFVLTRTSATIATMSFTGNAASHAFANSVTGCVFTWLGAAFTGGVIPADGSQTTTFAINFVDPTPAGGSINLRGTTYTINAHPRIWYTAGRQTALVARSVAGNYIWDQLKIYADANAANATTLGVNNIIASLNFAVAYYGTNKVSTTYRDAAINALVSGYCAATPTYSGAFDYASIDLMYLAMAYDWMYADMSAGQRTTVRNFVNNNLLPLLYTHPANHHAPATWAGPNHNLNITKAVGELMWSLASMDDDVAVSNPLAQYNYNHWIDKLWGATYFVGGDVAAVGGHCWSGTHYGHGRVQQWWGYAADALETSLVSMTGWRTPIRDYMSYFLHSLLPPETTYFHGEWEPSTYLFDNSGRYVQSPLPHIQKYTASTDSQYMQYWIVNKMFPRFISSDYRGLWHIWYDPATTATNYTAAPLGYVATGTAIGFSRSAWQTATSCHLTFSCGAQCSDPTSNSFDHQSNTAGSYKIFRNGEMVVVEAEPRYNAGYTGSSTASANANILFLGNGIVGSLTNGGYTTRDTANTVTIDKSTVATTYQYMRGNLTTAYDATSHPVTYAHRNVVHFRPLTPSIKDYFVFMDVINSTNSETKKEYIYVSQVPSIAANVASFTTASNKVFVQKILPAAVSLAQEVVTDPGTPNDFTQETSDVITRLTINDTTAGNYQCFLWVIHVGATSTTMPTCTALTGASGNLQGVLIDDNVSRIYFGSKDNATIAGTFSFTVTPTNTPAEYVFSGLTAGTQYTLSGTAPNFTLTSGGGAKVVDSSGVLRFTN